MSLPKFFTLLEKFLLNPLESFFVCQLSPFVARYRNSRRNSLPAMMQIEQHDNKFSLRVARQQKKLNGGKVGRVSFPSSLHFCLAPVPPSLLPSERNKTPSRSSRDK